MTEAGYVRYLRESRKRELNRISLDIPNPDGLYARLEELMATKWLWGVLPHNCVGFVEELLDAGGADWGSYSNCPALATSPSVTIQVQTFLMQLENAIYSAYGVPQ